MQIILDSDEPTQFSAFALTNPRRIVLDVDGSIARQFRNTLSFNNRGITRVRTGARSDTQMRIVIDLGEDFYWKAYSQGKRVIVEVFDYPVVNASATSAAVGNEGMQIAKPHRTPPNITHQTPMPVKPVTSQPPQSAVETPVTESKSRSQSKENPLMIKAPVRTVTLETHPRPKPITPRQNTSQSKMAKTPETHQPIAKEPIKPKPQATQATAKVQDARNTQIQQEKSRDIVVVIDPGHGGKDPGAIGHRHSREKDLVLQIAKRLKIEIDAAPGMRAVLTRNGDKYLSLRTRPNLGRKYKADLFVSIHADAFVNTEAKGSSVFILSNRGASSEAARWLAQNENASDLKYGVNISDYDDDVGRVLLDIQQNATLESSQLVGKSVLRELKSIGNVHKASVERAGFAVLKSPDIPSILVETAFISNPAEEARLKDAAYQKKLAKAIASGIQNYYDNHLPHNLLILEPTH